MNLKKLIEQGRIILEANSINRAKYESILLFSKINKLNYLSYYLNENKKISFKNVKVYLKKIFQRARGKPFSKIIGKREFYSREFFISKRTLDPRPETELLVDKIKDLTIKKPKIKILDLGTGSGCILISLYLELINKIDIYGVGTDICENALKIAKKNAILHKVQKNLIFLNSNWFSNISEKFDLIVSNPPYIRNCDIRKLSPEVKKFDPFLALDGGKDGLECYRIISKSAKKYLNSGGFICVEIGNNQSGEIRKIFNIVGLHLYEDHKDYSNIRRVMIFKK